LIEAALIVSIDDQLALLGVELCKSDFANMDDACCIHMIAQHNIGFALAETKRTSRLWINRKSACVARSPNDLRTAE
jgi:hypothetical protein